MASKKKNKHPGKKQGAIPKAAAKNRGLSRFPEEDASDGRFLPEQEEEAIRQYVRRSKRFFLILLAAIVLLLSFSAYRSVRRVQKNRQTYRYMPFSAAEAEVGDYVSVQVKNVDVLYTETTSSVQRYTETERKRNADGNYETHREEKTRIVYTYDSQMLLYLVNGDVALMKADHLPEHLGLRVVSDQSTADVRPKYVELTCQVAALDPELLTAFQSSDSDLLRQNASRTTADWEKTFHQICLVPYSAPGAFSSWIPFVILSIVSLIVILVNRLRARRAPEEIAYQFWKKRMDAGKQEKA